MRFGVPQGGCFELLPVLKSQIQQVPVSPPKTDAFEELKTPLQSLQETLHKLDALCLEKAPIVSYKLESRQLLSKLSSSRQSAIGSLEQLFDSQILQLQRQVEATVEEHEKNLVYEQELRTQEKEKKKQREEELRRQEEERKKQKEKEREERELREKKEAEKKHILDARKDAGFTNPSAVEKELLKYLERISQIKATVVNELLKNLNLKKSVSALKRKINVKFGQLSNSMTQLRTITSQVVELINSCKSEPLAFQWILNSVAKLLVSQAETEVTVKPTAALPLGQLAVALLNEIDGLDYYLSARIVKKCPLVLGYTCPLKTDEDRTRMGWKHQDQVWERETKYEERIGGILSLWAVMACLGLFEKTPLFSKEAQWRFVARILNTKLELVTDVHYVLLCNWWEAAGASFAGIYKSQAEKLLLLASQDFASNGVQKSFAAATRLSVLGEDLFKRGNFNSLKPMEQ